MTGRGSHIVLGAAVVALGGLCGLLPSAEAGGPTQLDGDLDALRRERFQLATKTYERLVKGFDGWWEAKRVTAAADRLLEADLALSEDPRHRVAALERHLGRFTQFRMVERETYNSGRIPLPDYRSFFEYKVRDAKLLLWDAKQHVAGK